MKRKAKVREAFWVGLEDGKIHLYSSADYYSGVRHGDIFRTRADAKKCYVDVVRVTVERREAKRG